MFVYAYSEFGDPDRVIILATEKKIIILKNNEIWFDDGTFSISPELFYQVYTENVIIRGKDLPMCFVLLSDKNEITKNKMFRAALAQWLRHELRCERSQVRS